MRVRRGRGMRQRRCRRARAVGGCECTSLRRFLAMYWSILCLASQSIHVQPKLDRTAYASSRETRHDVHSHTATSRFGSGQLSSHHIILALCLHYNYIKVSITP